MSDILINHISGVMAVIPEGRPLGTGGDVLIADDNCSIRSVDDGFIAHLKLGHCVVVDGAPTILPESEWPENIPDEEDADVSN